MKKTDYYREVQTRERLAQIFLIISGFLLAYSKEEIKQLMALMFIMYILFTVLYYIYLTRTKNDSAINIFGVMSAYTFSLLLLVFIIIQLKDPFPTYSFYMLFIVLTAIFSFAFLSPNSSEKLVKRAEKRLIRLRINILNY